MLVRPVSSVGSLLMDTEGVMEPLEPTTNEQSLKCLVSHSLALCLSGCLSVSLCLRLTVFVCFSVSLFASLFAALSLSYSHYLSFLCFVCLCWSFAFFHSFIHSFILNIYIAPLQENYSEALPTPARSNKAVLR